MNERREFDFGESPDYPQTVEFLVRHCKREYPDVFRSVDLAITKLLMAWWAGIDSGAIAPGWGVSVNGRFSNPVQAGVFVGVTPSPESDEWLAGARALLAELEADGR